MINDAGSIVSNLQFRPLSQADALDMVSWRYPWPYSVYDLNAQDSGVLAELLRPENRYHAILRDGEMAGFFCLGPEARVPGWSYDQSALDLGMGLRPDWTGQGRGHGCLMSVLSFVERTSPAVVFRATVAAWNQRAIRVCRRAVGMWGRIIRATAAGRNSAGDLHNHSHGCQYHLEFPDDHSADAGRQISIGAGLALRTAGLSCRPGMLVTIKHSAFSSQQSACGVPSQSASGLSADC